MATDWQALEIEYINGSITYKELADKHGLKEGTVRQRANRNGWVEKRNKLSQAVTEAAQERLADQRTNELAKFNEDDLKVARAIRAKVAQQIQKAGQGKGINAQDLRALAGALEASQRVGRLALGATTGNTGVSNPQGGPVQQEVQTGANEQQVRAIVEQLRGEFLGGDAADSD